MEEFDPMLTTQVSSLPANKGRVFEPLWHGERVIAYRSLEQMKLVSPDGGQLRGKRIIPLITRLPDSLGERAAVLDGVVIETRAKKLAMVVFDILKIDDTSLVDEPWHERRAILDGVVQLQPNILVSPYDKDGEAMQEAARGLGFAGVVAKRTGSSYQPGDGGKDWVELRFPH